MNQFITVTKFNPSYFVCGNAYTLVSGDTKNEMDGLLEYIEDDELGFVILRNSVGYWDVEKAAVSKSQVENKTTIIKVLMEIKE